jgi:hypothetical protein
MTKLSIGVLVALFVALTAEPAYAQSPAEHQAVELFLSGRVSSAVAGLDAQLDGIPKRQTFHTLVLMAEICRSAKSPSCLVRVADRMAKLNSEFNINSSDPNEHNLALIVNQNITYWIAYNAFLSGNTGFFSSITGT